MCDLRSNFVEAFFFAVLYLRRRDYVTFSSLGLKRERERERRGFNASLCSQNFCCAQQTYIAFFHARKAACRGRRRNRAAPAAAEWLRRSSICGGQAEEKMRVCGELYFIFSSPGRFPLSSSSSSSSSCYLLSFFFPKMSCLCLPFSFPLPRRCSSLIVGFPFHSYTFPQAFRFHSSPFSFSPLTFLFYLKKKMSVPCASLRVTSTRRCASW